MKIIQAIAFLSLIMIATSELNCFCPKLRYKVRPGEPFKYHLQPFNDKSRTFVLDILREIQEHFNSLSESYLKSIVSNAKIDLIDTQFMYGRATNFAGLTKEMREFGADVTQPVQFTKQVYSLGGRRFYVYIYKLDTNRRNWTIKFTPKDFDPYRNDQWVESGPVIKPDPVVRSLSHFNGNQFEFDVCVSFQIFISKFLREFGLIQEKVNKRTGVVFSLNDFLMNKKQQCVVNQVKFKTSISTDGLSKMSKKPVTKALKESSLSTLRSLSDLPSLIKQMESRRSENEDPDYEEMFEDEEEQSELTESGDENEPEEEIEEDDYDEEEDAIDTSEQMNSVFSMAEEQPFLNRNKKGQPQQKKPELLRDQNTNKNKPELGKFNRVNLPVTNLNQQPKIRKLVNPVNKIAPKKIAVNVNLPKQGLGEKKPVLIPVSNTVLQKNKNPTPRIVHNNPYRVQKQQLINQKPLVIQEKAQPKTDNKNAALVNIGPSLKINSKPLIQKDVSAPQFQSKDRIQRKNPYLARNQNPLQQNNSLSSSQPQTKSLIQSNSKTNEDQPEPVLEISGLKNRLQKGEPKPKAVVFDSDEDDEEEESNPNGSQMENKSFQSSNNIDISQLSVNGVKMMPKKIKIAEPPVMKTAHINVNESTFQNSIRNEFVSLDESKSKSMVKGNPAISKMQPSQLKARQDVQSIDELDVYKNTLEDTSMPTIMSQNDQAREYYRKAAKNPVGKKLIPTADSVNPFTQNDFDLKNSALKTSLNPLDSIKETTKNDLRSSQKLPESKMANQKSIEADDFEPENETEEEKEPLISGISLIEGSSHQFNNKPIMNPGKLAQSSSISNIKVDIPTDKERIDLGLSSEVPLKKESNKDSTSNLKTASKRIGDENPSIDQIEISASKKTNTIPIAKNPVLSNTGLKNSIDDSVEKIVVPNQTINIVRAKPMRIIQAADKLAVKKPQVNVQNSDMIESFKYEFVNIDLSHVTSNNVDEFYIHERENYYDRIRVCGSSFFDDDESPIKSPAKTTPNKPLIDASKEEARKIDPAFNAFITLQANGLKDKQLTSRLTTEKELEAEDISSPVSVYHRVLRIHKAPQETKVNSYIHIPANIQSNEIDPLVFELPNNKVVIDPTSKTLLSSVSFVDEDSSFLKNSVVISNRIKRATEFVQMLEQLDIQKSLTELDIKTSRDVNLIKLDLGQMILDGLFSPSIYDKLLSFPKDNHIDHTKITHHGAKISETEAQAKLALQQKKIRYERQLRFIQNLLVESMVAKANIDSFRNFEFKVHKELSIEIKNSKLMIHMILELLSSSDRAYIQFKVSMTKATSSPIQNNAKYSAKVNTSLTAYEQVELIRHSQKVASQERVVIHGMIDSLDKIYSNVNEDGLSVQLNFDTKGHIKHII